MNEGATELDMVVNIGKVLSKDWRYVLGDIRAVVEAGALTQGVGESDFRELFLD